MLFLTIFLSIIIIDLFTKYLASIYLLQNKINIIGDFLYLKYIENTGIAFSIPLEGFLLKIVTIVIIIGFFYYYFKSEKPKKNILIDISFGLILGGASANAYERIFNSKVIDWVGVQYFSVMNLADIFITIGVIIYFYKSVFQKDKAEDKFKYTK